MSKDQPNPAGNEGASSKEEDKFQSSIWLEVANVHARGRDGSKFRLKAIKPTASPYGGRWN